MALVEIPDELAAWGLAQVDAGHCGSLSELATRVLAEAKRSHEEFLTSLDEASAQIERGECYSSDEVFAELRARMKAMAKFERDWKAGRRNVA